MFMANHCPTLWNKNVSTIDLVVNPAQLLIPLKLFYFLSSFPHPKPANEPEVTLKMNSDEVCANTVTRDLVVLSCFI